MNDPKVLFVKQFLAMLFQEGVKTIPINDEKFNAGVEAMSVYFRDHASDFGPYKEKLDMLFLKYSTRGDYQRLADIIESFNGRLVSLENPHYIKANLKFKDEYDKQLSKDQQLEIGQECYKELVRCFCDGAEIMI